MRLRTAFLPAVNSLPYNSHPLAISARLRAQHPTGQPGMIAGRRKLLHLCYARPSIYLPV
jgi:hypothetical protein